MDLTLLHIDLSCEILSTLTLCKTHNLIKLWLVQNSNLIILHLEGGSGVSNIFSLKKKIIVHFSVDSFIFLFNTFWALAVRQCIQYQNYVDLYLYASVCKQIKQPITSEIAINSRIQKQALYRGVVQMLKNLPAMQETQVQSLGREDPLRGKWQPTAVFLPGEFLGPEEPGRLQSQGSQGVGHNWATN